MTSKSFAILKQTHAHQERQKVNRPSLHTSVQKVLAPYFPAFDNDSLLVHPSTGVFKRSPCVSSKRVRSHQVQCSSATEGVWQVDKAL